MPDPLPRFAKPSSPRPPDYDLWHAPPPSEPTFLPTIPAPKTRGMPYDPPKHAPAVEIDRAGCSYNPDEEQHQDALADAVAALVGKQLRKELEPVAPSGRVVVDEHGGEDDLGRLLVGGSGGGGGSEEAVERD